MDTDYTTVTEVPGIKASREQVARLYQRYHFAYQFCSGKEVLEVACGAGQGLGHLATVAKRVVGSDIEEGNLRFARKTYEGRDGVTLELSDAQELSYESGSFDVVILYEAIYYLTDPGRFIGEAHRVLRKNGLLIICTANKDWTDFNPSPYSVKYFSVPELRLLLRQKFSGTDFYGGFSIEINGLRNAVVSFIKRTAVSFNMMPKTMKGKELLKRVFMGELRDLPSEIREDTAEYEKPVPISSDSPNGSYKVIFAVARKEE